MNLKPLAIAALLAGSASLPAFAAGDYGSSSPSEPSVGERMESGAKAAAGATKRETNDAALTAKVKAALVREKELGPVDINVETENGVVQLFGFVDRQDQIDRAGKVAAKVEGVKTVKNDLKIDTSQGARTGQTTMDRVGGELSDATITTKVKAALVREKDLSAMDVNVETENGVVQLAGFVDRQDQIDRATQVAGNIQGVKSVQNDLKLKSEGTAASGTESGVGASASVKTDSALSDTAITAKVKSKLIAAKGVPARDIDVETHNGVVELAGFVERQDQIDKAGKVAARVKGVKSVKNDLQLIPAAGKTTMREEFSDAAITTKVKAALVGEKDLSAMDINVETENGVVQLAGFVDTQEQIDRATKVAESIKGVKSVKNDLHLKGGS